MFSDSDRVKARAPVEVWNMSTPAACLLLSQFAPATARLFAEFRRLRDSMTPAEARAFAPTAEEGMQDAEMMTAVRLRACQICRAPENLQNCGIGCLWCHTSCTSA